MTFGRDVDTPWRELPRKTRDWILFTDEQPIVPVYAGFTPAETKAALESKAEPSYQGTFTSVRRYVLHTFATTHSPLMKRRVSRFMTGSLCPTCAGKRLKRKALSVTFAGIDIGDLAHLPLSRVADILKPASEGRFAVADPAEAATRINSASARAATARREAAGAPPTPVHRTSPARAISPRRRASPLSASVQTSSVASGRWNRSAWGYLSLDRSTPILSPGELATLRRRDLEQPARP